MLYTREKILGAARFTTGLDDFGTDDFIEPHHPVEVTYKLCFRVNFAGTAEFRNFDIQ